MVVAGGASSERQPQGFVAVRDGTGGGGRGSPDRARASRGPLELRSRHGRLCHGGGRASRVEAHTVEQPERCRMVSRGFREGGGVRAAVSPVRGFCGARGGLGHLLEPRRGADGPRKGRAGARHGRGVRRDRVGCPPEPPLARRHG